ncbi:non-hydrolyzing UDP-N-acetylglucosamine 2-epimerase [Legionella nagasakiensis]|uniref:non-hydrolyzing UDP-N-acetylglucosamine 2-epimerase n=1 Tax=Legionella nagasakiensis TaxID=535290 RepID=UPI001054CE5D|nr:UDP-N-acetylglucosamine 2-epimerase (non-hydrolyzing) [Legionella nagasakiensis]
MQEFKPFTVGCVLGTRPEVIKMAPVIFQLQTCAWAEVFVINTGQHKDMLDDMLDVFNVCPDADLKVMTANQSLGELTANLCEKLDRLMKNKHFDVLLAVGDTTTVFAASLIAFYHQIPFGHIEAGLRTFNAQEPFPEEMNRTLTAPLATWHFAPTFLEKENLLRENIPAAKIVVTGNPVIDALFWVLKNRPDQNVNVRGLANIIVVTVHRRENFGKNLQNICSAMIELTARFEHIHFILPIHPNPYVQQEIESVLHDKPRIHLLPPIKYDEFAHLMQRSLFVLTDSGGIQEEAPALHKPVLVLRNRTERPAIITEGVGLLIGAETSNIIHVVSQLLTDANMYSNMARDVSPYGDGNAAKRIVAALKNGLFTNFSAFSDSFVDT